MICSICSKNIMPCESVAYTPSGEVHVRCGKIGKAQGTEITLMSLYQEIQTLKRRVQDLERQAVDIPHRIG